MIDRENTIENLEQNIRWIEEIECHQFPGWGNVTMAMRDAVELLKEQEPRVLTWDEVERAEVCWMEQRGYEPYAELDATDWNPKCYGKEIRCWSAKPTKKQQDAVKWE